MTFARTIRVVETHTAGMPTRIVTSGLPPVPGATMAERAAWLRGCEEMTAAARMLCHEPRGHSGQFGALLTPPTAAGSVTGAVFFSPAWSAGGCGHATIAIATMLVETGAVAGPLPVEFGIDTPSGTVTARVHGSGTEVEFVAFRNVPSFLYRADQVIEVPGLGEVRADVCYGGNLYAYVWAPDLGMRVRAENLPRLQQLGGEVREAVIVQVSLDDLPSGVPARVGGVMFCDDPEHPEADMKNVLAGRVGFDRSPCGTGTSGWLAALHARGRLAVGEEFVNESITGGLFRGRVLEATSRGAFEAIIPEIAGSAFITGFHDFVLDPRDPYPGGFDFGAGLPAAPETTAAPAAGARDKVKFYRLAWDVIGSEYASRHEQYELFYAGAPFVTRAHSFRTFDWDGATGLVDDMLATYRLEDELEGGPAEEDQEE